MDSQAMTSAAPTPERLIQMAWGFAGPQCLVAAIDLELFGHVAKGADTTAALEKATGASRRGLTMLVDALVGFGLLVRRGPRDTGRLELAPDVKLFLVKDSQAYLGDFLRFHGTIMEKNWLELSKCVKTGKPVIAVDSPKEGAPLWDALVDGLFNLGFPGAQNLAQEVLRTQKKRPLRVLDVASGSGVWGLAQALAEPSTRVTFFDLKETLPHARKFAAKLGVASRVDELAGDIRTTDPGEKKYDVAILGHICHSEGAEHTKQLLAKMARTLMPGGTLAIAEFVPDDDRNGPALPLVFALNMLVNTTEGATFTFAEFRDWLGAAGFRDVRKLPGPSVSPLILATR